MTGAAIGVLEPVRCGGHQFDPSQIHIDGDRSLADVGAHHLAVVREAFEVAVSDHLIVFGGEPEWNMSVVKIAQRKYAIEKVHLFIPDNYGRCSPGPPGPSAGRLPPGGRAPPDGPSPPARPGPPEARLPMGPRCPIVARAPWTAGVPTATRRPIDHR